MKILFIHQNFPGQYVHIVRRLASQGGHQIVALGINSLDESRFVSKKIQYFRYPIIRGNAKDVHSLVMETETKVIRAEAVSYTHLTLPTKRIV